MITGGAGFIGGNLLNFLLRKASMKLVVIDKLTYAGSLRGLEPVMANPRVTFLHADVADQAAMQDCLLKHRPEVVIHLAAESHVDRSIEDCAPFLRSNIIGSAVLLEQCRIALQRHPSLLASFRFIQVSTDEVHGSLQAADPPWNEQSPCLPRSPYSASKAAADHLVMAWHHTHGIPAMVARCCNIYGPRQFPEKLIPLCLLKILHSEPIPLYGRGDNIRQWLHVDDLCDGLYQIAMKGSRGAIYPISSAVSLSNLELVRQLCRHADELLDRRESSEALITTVADRPGHDFRYALDPSRIQRECGWRAGRDFGQGLRETLSWYLEHRDWWQPVVNEALRRRAAPPTPH